MNIAKIIGMVVSIGILAVEAKSAEARTFPPTPSKGSTPYFQYPVSSAAGDGLDYAVESEAHKGADKYAIDFLYPNEGLDVYPTLPGTVVYADCKPPDYGCVVAIRHWDDIKWDKKYYSIYAHLQPRSITVKVGDIVDGNKPLGKMGMSGEGGNKIVHLHFAVRSSTSVYDGLVALYGQYDGKHIVTPAFNVKVRLSSR